MSDLANRAVFLSYASQDAGAAKRICDALRTAGVEVWFDQSELVGGDAWDQKIRRQIKDCALLIPIISAATQARTEGYFRLEWRLADQRTHLMAKGRPFLLPVVIDDTRDSEAHVPDSFTEVQWTRMPGGETTPAFAARVKKLLDGGEPVGGALRPDGSKESGRKAPPTLKPSRPWLIPALIGLVAITVVAVWFARKAVSISGASTQEIRSQVQDSKPMAPLTDAQKLVQQAQKIYENSDELDRETLVLADDLVKRALVLDPAEPSAWELSARISYTMVWQSFDRSEARMADLQRQAARARVLAPESVPAQVAQANARLAVAFLNFQSANNRQDLAGVEHDLLALAARAPADSSVQRALGQTYRFLKRPDEALRALQRALELSGGDPGVSADVINVLLRRKRYVEAEAMVAPALARRPIGRILAVDVFFKTQWRGDLAGAQAALAAWPGWLLREDRGTFMAWQTWLWSRRPDQALDVAERLQRDYLHDNFFTGPRAVLTARAHEMAGHQEAAQDDWRTVVRLSDRELATSPDAAAALFWKAWALSRLGDQAGAQAVCTLLQQRNLTTSSFFNATNLALLWSTMGRTDLAATHLRAGFEAADDTYAVTRAMLELDPAYEPLRADPHFAELAAAALAPAPPPAKPPSPSSLSLPGLRSLGEAGSLSTLSVADSKSVAVLAFTNLSEDKTNEYFSDGISEELLNVLAKVPGLKVTARTSSFHFKGMNTAIPEIAQQLGVAYVVEGSVRKSGDKVRITAQLIKAADGFHVWSDTFTRDLKDVFAVQDEIAGLIARNLELKMGIGAAASAVNPEAFDLYLQGRQAWNLRTLEGFDRAEELLKRSLQVDPGFARAHAALADVWMIRAVTQARLGQFDQRSAPEILRVVDEIQQALAIDPDSSEAHASLGFARLLEWNLTEAERDLRRSVALNPNYATGHHWLGTALQMGGFDEAVVEARHAAELDPFSQRILDNYGSILVLEGRPEEALTAFDRAIALQPGATQALSDKALVLLTLGRRDEALAMVGQLAPRDRVGLLAAAGKKAETEAALAQASGFDRYQLLAALGRYDEALDGLKPDDVSILGVSSWLSDPGLERFRQDPRLTKILTTLNLTDVFDRIQHRRAAQPPVKTPKS